MGQRAKESYKRFWDKGLKNLVRDLTGRIEAYTSYRPKSQIANNCHGFYSKLLLDSWLSFLMATSTFPIWTLFSLFFKKYFDWKKVTNAIVDYCSTPNKTGSKKNIYCMKQICIKYKHQHIHIEWIFPKNRFSLCNKSRHCAYI